MTTGFSCIIFVAQIFNTMKNKKEEKKKTSGNENNQTAEKEKNNDFQQEIGAETSDKAADLLEAWAPFLQKFIKVMIAIEDLVDAKKEMEADPYFVHVMTKFLAFKEKYEAEHPEVMEEVDDDYDCEDKELFDVVKEMKGKLQQCGISVKVRKVTDPEEVEKFESFMKGKTQPNGATPMADA